ncbi:MAG: DUF1499 domain-containing protein [Thermoanaerobaculia bacterium]
MPMMVLTVLAVTLAPCSSSPNCVSTEARDAHATAPFRYTGSVSDARSALLAILGAMPRTKIVESNDTTIRAEFTTRIFRFTDDATFVIDDATKTVRFRIARRPFRLRCEPEEDGGDQEAVRGRLVGEVWSLEFRVWSLN